MELYIYNITNQIKKNKKIRIDSQTSYLLRKINREIEETKPFQFKRILKLVNMRKTILESRRNR